MTPQLPFLLRIKTKIVVVWYVIRGHGVIYRANITGTGEQYLYPNNDSDLLYLAESNILGEI